MKTACAVVGNNFVSLISLHWLKVYDIATGILCNLHNIIDAQCVGVEVTLHTCIHNVLVKNLARLLGILTEIFVVLLSLLKVTAGLVGPTLK